jgi:uncharacterized repeat protein (TIGR03803 family)
MRTAFPFAGSGPKYPYGRLVPGTNGELYGTTYVGGTSSRGTVFKVTTGGSWTTLAAFAITNGSNPTYGGLTLGTDGNFYGNTYIGGASNVGTIFKITHAGALTSLFSFRNTNGSYPNGWLTQTADGNFYGTTFGGGISNFGTIYRLSPAGAVTTLVSFRGTNGANPYAGLITGGDGNLYGTTFNGGSNDLGTVFRVATNGALTPLVSFSGTNGGFPGSSPLAALALGSDGLLYGTTEYGGSWDAGTLFRVSTNGSFANLHAFNVVNGDDPQAGLVAGPDGWLYGTTYGGGSSSNGTVFRLSTNAVFEALVSLDITNGPGPIGNLALAADGNFYGTTQYGGYDAVGAVFRLVTNPAILAIMPAGGNVVITWSSFTNGLYQVDYKSAVTAPGWTPLLPNVTAIGATASKLDAAGGTQRFYRVTLLP